MIDLKTIKPGDRVVTLWDDMFCPANGDWFDVPAGSVFVVANPAVDMVNECARLAHDKAPSGAFLVVDSLIRMEGDDPDGDPDSCKCKPWLTCKCGLSKIEQESKSS